jgi:uncharacterized RDD family membrane protein YckC
LSTSPQSAAIDEELRSIPAWKQEVNARLSAHRSRRTNGSERQPALPGLESDVSTPESRAARVAARVAERYSKAPTYSEMLAAEAANAARAAAAAAQAAQEAHAAAQAILAGLDMPETELPQAGPELVAPVEIKQVEVKVAPVQPVPEPIRYHVNPQSLPEPRRSPERTMTAARARIAEIVDPFEDAVVVPAQPLPARLIEFPRELIATRKARPRFAEGPLRESGTEPDQSQLRIFEVEPEAISKEPVVDPVLPEWHSIRLDARPVEEETRTERLSVRAVRSQGAGEVAPAPKRTARDLSHPYAALLEMLPLHVAPMEDRMMAGIVDTALVLVAFLLFVLVFVACTAHPPTGKAAMVSGAFVLVGFFVLYQWLFFNYGHGTPGMRYAKIALCTFDDENPSRKAMRARVGGLLLSALPLGLGYLWALFDDDRLTWHDRMTQTYQRSYR